MTSPTGALYLNLFLTEPAAVHLFRTRVGLESKFALESLAFICILSVITLILG